MYVVNDNTNIFTDSVHYSTQYAHDRTGHGRHSHTLRASVPDLSHVPRVVRSAEPRGLSASGRCIAYLSSTGWTYLATASDGAGCHG